MSRQRWKEEIAKELVAHEKITVEDIEDANFKSSELQKKS